MKKMPKISFTAVVAAMGTTFLLFQPAVAQTNLLTNKAFDLTFSVNGTTTKPIGFSSVEDLFAATSQQNLVGLVNTYTPISSATIDIGFRGLAISFLANANSPAMTLKIPSINESIIFDKKPTRDENIDDMKNYLKGSTGSDIVRRFQQQLAKVSPIDPVAGNPASAQSNAVTSDYGRSFTSFASNIKKSANSNMNEAVNNLFGANIEVGNFSQNGVSTQSITIPFSYTIRSDIDPNRQLSFYAPVTVMDSLGSKSYSVSLGTSYRLPVNDEWALTPALGYSITGSNDLGSAAGILGVSVTSQYTMQFENFSMAMGNMIGVYQTNKITVGDYSVDPGIKNTVFRNGLLLSLPVHIFETPMSLEFDYVNTLYTGTDLYSNKYNEFGIALGTNKNAGSKRSYIRGSLTYLMGENNIKGTRLNLGFWF